MRARCDTIRLTDDDTAIRHGRPLSASWEQALYEQIMRDLPMPDTREEPTAIFFAPAPNVFETPRAPTDEPPPWETRPLERRRPRRSKLPFLFLAMVLGIGLGLWRDHAARADVVARAHAITTLLHR